MGGTRWEARDGRHAMEGTRWEVRDGRHAMEGTRWEAHNGRHAMEGTRWKARDGRVPVVAGKVMLVGVECGKQRPSSGQEENYAHYVHFP
jgi:hypothetical protein